MKLFGIKPKLRKNLIEQLKQLHKKRSPMLWSFFKIEYYLRQNYSAIACSTNAIESSNVSAITSIEKPFL
jgi:hypothetical protein